MKRDEKHLIDEKRKKNIERPYIISEKYIMEKTFDGVPLCKISLAFGVPIGKIFSWGTVSEGSRSYGRV